ncbi:MAG: hypothetical protein ACOYVK_13310 [Bacillota bacterium]
MKTMKMSMVLFLIFCMIFSFSGCGSKPKKPSTQEENAQKPMPKVIEEIEKDALKIMEQADMIPYFQKIIVEKQIKEMESSAQQSNVDLSISGSGENKLEVKADSSEKSEEDKPQSITIEDSILSEILKKEKENSDEGQTEKPPKDIEETWKKINDLIKGLHGKWNVLEPQLTPVNVPPEMIGQFEDTLNQLTKFGFDKKYFETISTANNLTAHLPKFMTYYKYDIPPHVYTLKYHIRDIVLNASVGNFQAAQDSLDKFRELSQGLKSELIKKKAQDVSDKLDASVTNLQNAIKNKDMLLLKINAGIVAKNVMLIKDALTGSM